MGESIKRRDGPTSVRLPADLKQRLVLWARTNRKTLNSEIVARLQRSLDLSPGEPPPEPLASETAKNAYEKASNLEPRVRTLEHRLTQLEINLKELETKLGRHG